ncbi:ROK family protein [Schaalia sp. 19OD2882]|uniref:ROK family protein n=1 Tax=Schaalia sp. 19OD2882 TaxID=2794089 RepID=UPI001C1EFAC0|nr:ROK family protein [Schaalia sp. 19OD2882]QWW18767.1 ROK family protein [Schaalia sp. 19OD2882]
MTTHYVLALDIGGTKIAAGHVPVSGEPRVVGGTSVPTDAMRGGAAVLASIVDLVTGMLERAPGRVMAIGIGSAGVADPATGWITSATGTMPGWGGTPLGPTLQEATGLPVHLLGDVWAHALGEHLLGAGRGHSSCLAVGIGTGIGGAMVEGGRVHTGAHNVAGHVGHLPHVLAEGRKCSCGRIGHVEPIASGTGIAREYLRLTAEEVDGRTVDERAEAGDSAAVRVVEAAGRALGETIGALANVLDPAIIVLSGSVTRSGRTWWQAVRGGYAAQAMNPVAATPIVVGELGGHAPLLGAALGTGIVTVPGEHVSTT